MKHHLFRKAAVVLACAVALPMVSSAWAYATPLDPGNKNAGCNQDPYGSSGNGANHSGPYDDTCNGSASQNGNGGGNATGKPCAGCVGKADEKNPQGQYPNGSDNNAGYECDRNSGIGKTNPAHTGCIPASGTTPFPSSSVSPSPSGSPGGPGDQQSPASVLGEQVTATPSASVLGLQIANNSPVLFGSALARTGLAIGSLVLLAGFVLLVGASFRMFSKKRGRRA